MGFKEYSAKTLDEAITLASIDMGVPSSELHYDITEKGSGGILGFGRKDVTIRAIKLSELNNSEEVESEAITEISPVVRDEVEQTEKKRSNHHQNISKDEDHKHSSVVPLEKVDEEEVKKVAKDFLTDVFEAMGLQVDIAMSFSDKDNSLSIDFSGSNMGIIIGKRGQTLDSLQYLVNLVVNKHAQTYIRIKLDTEDYRRRRKETLENLAKNIANKVKKSGKPVTLEAMNPYERRTIHYTLQKDRYVTTYSEGEEPFRHVVVTTKK